MARAPSRRLIRSAAYRGVAQAEHLGLYPNGRPCHFCGVVLRDAADEHTVYVRVADGIVFLHPACALTLGQVLLTEGFRADEDEFTRWTER